VLGAGVRLNQDRFFESNTDVRYDAGHMRWRWASDLEQAIAKKIILSRCRCWGCSFDLLL